MKVAKDDLLAHHSRPGPYRVLDVMHDGRVILLDPEGERQRVRPDYLADNFTRAELPLHLHPWNEQPTVDDLPRTSPVEDENIRLRAALGVCVDRLIHGTLPGNEHWWDLARPLLADERRTEPYPCKPDIFRVSPADDELRKGPS